MPDMIPVPEARPAQVPPAETPGVEGLTTLAVGVVIVAALYLGREVLVPITLAILLSFVLAPLAALLRRLHLGRVPSVILAVLVALGVILGLGGLIGTQIAELAGDLPRYQATIERKVNTVRSLTVERLSSLLRDAGREFHRAAPAAPQATPANPGENPPVPVEVQQPAPTPLELANRILSPVLSPIETTGIIFLVAVFILLQQEDLRDRMIRLFGSTDLHRTTAAMDDAARRLSRYFLTQLGINAAFGIIIGAGLLFLGLPSPLLWGVLATLLRFVPYVGSPLAGLLPVVLAAAIDPGWSTVVWTATLFLVTEAIMGQVVEPLLYGHSTGLSPVSVIIAAIFWGWLWGPIGLILSTPLTLCLVVLGRHVERLEFLDVLLGDRPALTPVENFYQRMLAGDPDEALEQAEHLLKDRSLSSYYDEVALKGLRLAANDVLRGVLTRPQVERIRDAVRDVVDALDEHDDSDPSPKEAHRDVLAPSNAEQRLPKHPAPDVSLPASEARAPEWRTEGAVLCVAGRGPLDDAAALILAQLLRKHGLGARTVSHDAVSRAGIGLLETQGIAMICVSYLEVSGNPSHLRYLLRRLRQRLPHAPVLIGLWPSNDPVLTNQDMRAAIGADHYIASLRAAVNACLVTARTASAGADQDEQDGAVEAASV